MYLIINGNRHSVARRIVTGNTIKFTSVAPAVEDISGMIQTCRNDGFVLAEDNADTYVRREMVGSLLTISNDPVPVPQVTIEQRVTAIENAITKGLSL